MFPIFTYLHLRRFVLSGAFLIFTTPLGAQTMEEEPNDDLASADTIGVGGEIEGVIGQPGDVDYFAISAEVGDILDVHVEAGAIGSPLTSVVRISRTDGSPAAPVRHGSDVRVRPLLISEPGTLFIRVVDAGSDEGSSEHRYRIRLDTVPHGPGDPATVRRLPQIWNAAAVDAGRDGALYLVESAGGVWRIPAAGDPIAIRNSGGGDWAYDLAVDAFGDILRLDPFPSGSGAIRRIDPATGEMDVFVSMPGHRFNEFSVGELPRSLAASSHGDVWVARTPSDRSPAFVFRFNAYGEELERVDATRTGAPWLMEVSPSGVLHVVAESSLYRLTEAGEFVLAHLHDEPIRAMTFDDVGRIYLVGTSRVTRLAPDYVVLNASFAVAYGNVGIAFWTSESGTPTDRLSLVSYSGSGEFAESATQYDLNRSGIDDPGPPSEQFVRIVTSSVVPAVLGAPYEQELAADRPGTVWSIGLGALPPGLSLSSDGRITGVPEAAGNFEFVVNAQAGEASGSRAFALSVAGPVLSVDAVMEHLFHGTGLEADEVRYLDLIGNRNGRLDVGDVGNWLDLQ